MATTTYELTEGTGRLYLKCEECGEDLDGTAHGETDIDYMCGTCCPLEVVPDPDAHVIELQAEPDYACCEACRSNDLRAGAAYIIRGAWNDPEVVGYCCGASCLVDFLRAQVAA